MTGSHGRRPQPNGDDTPLPPRPRRRRRGGWRAATPLVLVVGGLLCAVSAVNSDGTDLRPGRYTSLASLVQGDADEYQQLRQQVGDLSAQVEQLGNDVDDAQVKRRQREVRRLRGPAGLSPASGPGVTVVLSDAPTELLEQAALARDPEVAPSDLVVHQQDIQAVVNAMWAGGARAVTIQGQRVVSTTGIKCAGSQVQLQGVPYPQPYTMQAIGDPSTIAAALAASSRLQDFRAEAARPEIGIGYAETAEASVTVPAYDGLLDLGSARPLG